MKLGIVIEETWDFFKEVFADLSSRYTTSLFSRRVIHLPFFKMRINRYLFNRDLRNFLLSNDIVFFEWASELLVEATRYPKLCKLITRLHRYEMYQWAHKVNWDNVDRIILVSLAKEREFLERFPGQKGKTVVIPEAISIERFQFRPKKFNGDIGILCHLTPRKRVYELILGFYELFYNGEDFHLHIGGGTHPKYPDYEIALHGLVKQLGLEDKVTFYNRVNNPERWYQNIDIFVSNSYSEGLQVAPMEAMVSGCYCLSHRWDGVEELLPQENLYYTNGELIEKIISYCQLSDEEKLKKITQLRDWVYDNFNVDKTIVKIRQVIDSLGVTPDK